MRLIYSLLLYLLLPLVVTRLLWRGLRNRGYWYRWPERLGLVPTLMRRPNIWVHAVSVGEVRAAVPLVEALMKQHPDHDIVFTTMTPTGSEQVRLLFGDRVHHFYVPYDLPTAVFRFMNRVRPQLAVILETELWPNLYHACRRRNIPVCMANVRISASSMKGYRKLKRLTKDTLDQVSYLAAQSREDAERLLELGADQVRLRITGSIKFDFDIPDDVVQRGQDLRQHWDSGRKILLAASTHEGEEAEILQVFEELRRNFPGLLLVLVPRHPERFTPVVKLCEKEQYRVYRRSEQQHQLPADIDILVGDTMGELQMFYSAVDVAFIGGSLVPVGGHNLLEAAAVGTPVVYGPHMFNFAEISQLALEKGVAMQGNSTGEVTDLVAQILGDEGTRHAMGKAGRQLMKENKGALQRTLEWFAPALDKLK